MAQLNDLIVTGNSRFLNDIHGNADTATRASIHTVIGTQTAATGSWTGALHNVSALYDGLTIMYYLPYAGSGNATLNLTLDNGTTTGAVNCYYNTGRLTTHYGAGCNIVMTYWSAGSIKVNGTATTDNRWIANANYTDGNSLAYNVTNYYNRFKAGANKIFPYTIIMQCSDGRWESIVTSSSTGTSKARNTHGFRLGQIALMYANATYNENATVGDNTIQESKTDLIDHRYSFNTANDSTNGTTATKPVYLVGAINSSDGLFYLDTTWWTQTLPTTANGKLYIYLGDAYDYYRMTFRIHHPIYWYSNGKVREFNQDSATVNGHTVDKDVPSNAVFTDNNNAVTQTNTTENADYRVLFSATADDTTRTEGARKSTRLKFNPSKGALTAYQFSVSDLAHLGYAPITGSSSGGSIALNYVDYSSPRCYMVATDTGGSLTMYNDSNVNTINLWGNDGSIAAHSLILGNGCYLIEQDITESGTSYKYGEIELSYTSNNTVYTTCRINADANGSGIMNLYDTTGNTKIALDGSTGTVTATTFNGKATYLTDAGNTAALRYINSNDITTWTADALGATDSISVIRGNVTGAWTTGHIAVFNCATVGTPFQLGIHDAGDLYFYKRAWNSSKSEWGPWSKMNAGNADTASTASDASKLGGASASESATASTIVKRNSSGYIYAAYYNESNSAENPASYTSYAVFKDSSGWLRCSTLANFKSWFGAANYATLTNAGSTTGTTAKGFSVPAAATEIIVTGRFSSKILSACIPKALLTTSNQEIWLTGGKSAAANGNDGALRCLCYLKISTTSGAATVTLTGLTVNDGATDKTSSTTWNLFYR